MKIRRDAQGYLLLKGGVIETELTGRELEQAYRIRSMQYQMEDIGDAIQSAYETGTITENVYRKCINNRSVKRAVLEQYDKICSCDIAYNDTMEQALRRVITRL